MADHWLAPRRGHRRHRASSPLAEAVSLTSPQILYYGVSGTACITLLVCHEHDCSIASFAAFGTMCKLCTYVVRYDTGLAPNPFHGWCTVAVCTPNHQGANLRSGDWMCGFLPKEHEYRLVYLMQIEQRIHLNDYFHDCRFSAKRPDLGGNWISRCGDNFYSLASDRSWIRHPNLYHTTRESLTKDTRNPYVFVGQRFWYFGENAVSLLQSYRELAGGRGIRVNHRWRTVESFIDWVCFNWDVGIHGRPLHRESKSSCLTAGITKRSTRGAVDSKTCS